MATPLPAEFYAHELPRLYAEAMANASPAVLDQPELSASIAIEGEGGGLFGVRAQGRELLYVPGGIPDADLHVRTSIADWRSGIENGAADMVLDYIQRRKVQVVKSLKGTVELELERSDGSMMQTATTFGQHAEPAVTIIMTAEDYAAMVRGELNGQMAFMMGKLRFEGSLPLLMAIGALTGQ